MESKYLKNSINVGIFIIVLLEKVILYGKRWRGYVFLGYLFRIIKVGKVFLSLSKRKNVGVRMWLLEKFFFFFE